MGLLLSHGRDDVPVVAGGVPGAGGSALWRIKVSTSGVQAAAFFREVARTRTVWWVRDDDGSPTPVSSSGQPAFPYWSSKTRAQRAAQLWGPEFRAVSMPLDPWRRSALPDLAKEDFRIGINWSGQRLTGWDFTVGEVVDRLIHALGEPPCDQVDPAE
jgi:hypothetical protein